MKILSILALFFSLSATAFSADIPVEVSGASVPRSGDCGGGEALKNAMDNYHSQCESDERDLGCSSCDAVPTVGTPITEQAKSSDGGCKTTISVIGAAHGCTEQ
jgi:hypothetical protein